MATAAATLLIRGGARARFPRFSRLEPGAFEMLVASIGQVAFFSQSSWCSTGAYEIPTIAPSGD